MNRRQLVLVIVMLAVAAIAGSWLAPKLARPASGHTASRTMTVDPYGEGLTSIDQALALIPANPVGAYTIRLWTGNHNPGNILKPNTVVTGVDKGAVTMVVNGGQTGFRMAQGSRLSNVTILANADANGDAVAIDANDKSFTVEDVDIRMTRTASRALGVYEPYGTSPATIELRRVSITDDGRSNYGRAIKVSEGNVWNKLINVRDSYLATGTTSATVEVDAWGSSKLNFYDSLVLGGGVNSTTGGEAYSTEFGNYVWSGRAGNYLGFYQSYMEKLRNGSAGILSARNSHARTVENMSPLATTWWWSGTLNVVDSSTYPGPPLGTFTWREHDRQWNVIAKMGIQDAIDYAALTWPAPSVDTLQAVLVSPDRYVGDITMRPYVNVVGTSVGSTYIVGMVTPAQGAELANITVVNN